PVAAGRDPLRRGGRHAPSPAGAGGRLRERRGTHRPAAAAGAGSKRRPRPPPWRVSLRVSTATTTERPGRSSAASLLPAGTAIRTGTRCTTLVKLPVAF